MVTVEEIRFVADTDALAKAWNAADKLDHKMDDLANAGEGLTDLPISAPFDKAAASAQKLLMEQRALKSEMDHEAQLAAKIATFDGNRARNIAKMREELAKMNKEAVGGATPKLPNATKAANDNGLDVNSLLSSLGIGGGKIEGATSALGAGGMAAGIAGAAAALVAAAAALAAAAAQIAAQILIAGSKLAISSSAFRENTEKSFEFLLGSASAARDLYEKALDVADEVGLEKEQVVAQLKHLLTSGFGKEEALAAIEAAGNLAQVMGEEGANKLLDILSTAKAKGVFDTKAIKALAAVGIQTEEIYKKLAQNTGKSIDEIRQQVKAGLLDAETGAKAIEDVINEKLGGAGAKAGASFDRLFGDLKSNFERLFDGVDLSPIKNAMSAVIEAMKGPAGDRIKAALNKIFGGIFDALFGAFDQKRVDALMNAIADGLEVVGDIITAIGPIVKELIGELLDGFVAIEPALRAAGEAIAHFFSELGKHPEAIEMIKFLISQFLFGSIPQIADGIRSLVDSIRALGGAADGASGSLQAIVDTVTGFFGIFSSSGSTMGQSIIDGLVGGIFSGTGSVASAMMNLAMTALSTFMNGIGAHSPSTKFRAAGIYSWQGYTGGLDEGVDKVENAARKLGAGAVAGAVPSNDNGSIGSSPVGAALGGAGGMTNHITVNSPAPVVNLPPGTTPEDAHKLGGEAQRGVREQFQRDLIEALRRAS